MGQHEIDKGILKIQGIILAIVLVVLAVSIIADLVESGTDYYLGFAAVVLLIIATPIRIVAVARFFSRRGNSRYRFLSYMVILIIVLTALIRALI